MRIQKTDLVNQVYETLKQNILNGNLAPETPLRQEELSDTLGVSRQPISHALVLLEREGLVAELGRKGKMVTKVDAQHLSDLYQVRAELDGLAASLCALNPSEELRTSLAAVTEQGRAAIEKQSVEALLEADIAFHRALYDHSGNPEIGRVADNSWSHLVRAMHQVLNDKTIHESVWDDHERIAESILAGDADTARELARSHANSSGRMTFLRLNTSVQQ
jgi:DNA-binding GntR family transcriptional regulator